MAFGECLNIKPTLPRGSTAGLLFGLHIIQGGSFGKQVASCNSFKKYFPTFSCWMKMNSW
jgi:hypothetical protein